MLNTTGTGTGIAGLPKAKRTTKAKVAKAAPVKKARLGVAETRRIAQLLEELAALYPEAHCELNFDSPFQLLISVILSAQCTDDRVNMVTPHLFARFPDARALADSDPDEVEKIIHSTGFFRAKTQSIRLCAKKLCDKFGGQVPQTMPELLSLRGVARKTANCVLGSAFGIPSGVVVDTHIARLSARLGLTKETDPVKIEKDLMARWPQEQWIVAGHRLIWHGRRVCAARKPACDRCSLVPLCPSAVL